MPRKAQLLNSLSRGRVRASWNKYNLYNLYKKGRVNFQGQNLYQQKWTSKQETRAYHGEHLTESRFQSTFSSKLESVAHLDASLRGENSTPTPLPLQTYAILEKRLDFALFRSMFASSVRQARQFILQGSVFVNGINIRQPGFTLQAGDIFNVTPEKVLTALGAPKPALKQSVKVDSTQIAKWNQFVSRALKNPKKLWEERENSKSRYEIELSQDKIKEFNKGLETKMLTEQKRFSRHAALKQIIELGITTESPILETFTTKFSKEVSEVALKLYQKVTSAPGFNIEDLKGLKSEELSNLVSNVLDKDAQSKRSGEEKKLFSDIKQLVSSVQITHQEDLRKAADLKKLDRDAKSIPYDSKWTDSLSFHPSLKKSEILENEKSAKVKLPWQQGLFGRQNPSKPYFTPWKVRPFIAPFAILPSHIEVSFETCHAVYMRDPVALPVIASPWFNSEKTAFNPPSADGAWAVKSSYKLEGGGGGGGGGGGPPADGTVDSKAMPVSEADLEINPEVEISLAKEEAKLPPSDFQLNTPVPSEIEFKLLKRSDFLFLSLKSLILPIVSCNGAINSTDFGLVKSGFCEINAALMKCFWKLKASANKEACSPIKESSSFDDETKGSTYNSKNSLNALMDGDKTSSGASLESSRSDSALCGALVLPGATD
ncbi:hypothetical protein WICMUC_001010 [Wickerhamomyces mucosus]|uniref:Small ribosomal subunit protein uS4m n=1 Tax=Wickerhamomyces mucosus TaxID=1378264 RepID=A0A9P8PXG4_9ASCO|nr:hypothetical protein WICMUC_001010 [Wickerhamomyces mucosus]